MLQVHYLFLGCSTCCRFTICSWGAALAAGSLSVLGVQHLLQVHYLFLGCGTCCRFTICSWGALAAGSLSAHGVQHLLQVHYLFVRCSTCSRLTICSCGAAQPVQAASLRSVEHRLCQYVALTVPSILRARAMSAMPMLRTNSEISTALMLRATSVKCTAPMLRAASNAWYVLRRRPCCSRTSMSPPLRQTGPARTQVSAVTTSVANCYQQHYQLLSAALPTVKISVTNC